MHHGAAAAVYAGAGKDSRQDDQNRAGARGGVPGRASAEDAGRCHQRVQQPDHRDGAYRQKFHVQGHGSAVRLH